MQGVNVEMDEYYSDFLAKQMSVRLTDKKSKISVLQKNYLMLKKKEMIRK
jgi:hypothetical protein